MSSFTIDTESGPSCNWLVQSIILTDFPGNNTYYLLLNNKIATTATHDGCNLRFDFNDQQSNIIKTYNDICLSESDRNVPNRSDYLRFDRVESIKITSKTKLPNKSYDVKLVGLFYQDDQWIYKTDNISLLVD